MARIKSVVFISYALLFFRSLTQAQSQSTENTPVILETTSPTVLINACMNVTCHHGSCNNGQCICNDGFKKNTAEKFKCEQIVCPNENTEDKLFCVNACQMHCANGLCNLSGACDCNVGFAKRGVYKCETIKCPEIGKNSKYCKSQCDASCVNGDCDNAGNCTCHFGFRKLPSSRYRCEEIKCSSDVIDNGDYCKKKLCESSCQSGRCDNKGVCTICKRGYVIDSSENFTCRAVCNNKCSVREVCSKPDKCTCGEDFIAIFSDSECVPKCNVSSNCSNGICLKDAGRCSCKKGFGLDASNQCSPVCSQGCKNGECILPDVCLCYEGYVKRNGECVTGDNTALVLSGVTCALLLAYFAGRTGWCLAMRFHWIELREKDDFPVSLDMTHLMSGDDRPPCPLPRPDDRDTRPRKGSEELNPEYLDLFAENKTKAKDTSSDQLETGPTASSTNKFYENVDTTRAAPPPSRPDSALYENYTSVGVPRHGATTNQSNSTSNNAEDNDLDDDGYLLPASLHALRKKT